MATGITAAATLEANKKNQAQKAAAKAAATKGKFTQSADDLLNQVITNVNKTQSDPTALANTGTLPSSISNPAKDQGITIGIGDTGFDNSKIYQYFGNINGVGPQLTLSVDTKAGKKQPYLGLLNASGTLDYAILIGDPNDPTKFKVSSYSTGLKDYLKWAKDSGANTETLKKSLYEQGLVSPTEAKKSLSHIGEDETFYKAIINKLTNISLANYKNVQEQKYNSFSSYAGVQDFGIYGGAVPQTTVSINKQLLDSYQAGMTLDEYAQQYLGRNATSAEAASFIKQYNDLASKHPSKSYVTTDALRLERGRTTIGGVTAEDAKVIAIGVLSDALRQEGKNPANISKIGGLVGQHMTDLKQTAADYGLHYDDPTALGDAIKAIQAGSSVKDRINALRQLAKTQYKSFASAIDSGVTIREIANQYNQLNQKYLENMNPVDVMSSDMQKALTGGANGGQMNMNDYITYLKNKPEWAKTQNAREEAAGYVNQIGRMMGFIA